MAHSGNKNAFQAIKLLKPHVCALRLAGPLRNLFFQFFRMIKDVSVEPCIFNRKGYLCCYCFKETKASHRWLHISPCEYTQDPETNILSHDRKCRMKADIVSNGCFKR